MLKSILFWALAFPSFLTWLVYLVIFHLVWKRMLDSTRKEFAFPDNQKEAMRK